jgi:hypothetical protein
MLRSIVDRARVLIRAEAQIDPWFPRMRTRSADNPPRGGGAVRMGAGRTGPHSGMPANLNLHTTPGGPSAERVFFAMAVAFWVPVRAIVPGFAAARRRLTTVFGVLAVVLVHPSSSSSDG